jgi:hypothetical protein
VNNNLSRTVLHIPHPPSRPNPLFAQRLSNIRFIRFAVFG